MADEDERWLYGDSAQEDNENPPQKEPEPAEKEEEEEEPPVPAEVRTPVCCLAYLSWPNVNDVHAVPPVNFSSLRGEVLLGGSSVPLPP